MNPILRLSSSKGPILFCSDPHLHHRPNWVDTPALWESRGVMLASRLGVPGNLFKTGDEFDEWFYAEWLRLVTPETTVLSLGDHTFSDPKGESFRRFSRLPGRILALAGNHPSGLKTLYAEAIKARELADHEMLYPVTMGNLTLMGESIHAFIDGISVYMQHYPCFVWPEMGKKVPGIHLHGHCHRKLIESNPETTTAGKVLDIGVDNAIHFNGTPFFSWAEVQRIMAKKPVVKRDHH